MYPSSLMNSTPNTGVPSAAPMANMPNMAAHPGMRSFHSQAAPNAYSHGGATKRGKMIMVHMSPQELLTLDHLQGKTEREPRSGMRTYMHLEEILKNPHILSNIHHHIRAHKAGGQPQSFATGGLAQGFAGHRGPMQQDYQNPQLNQLANQGQHGDSELAMIGPHTHNLFNYMAGGHTVNPVTGYPQYWSLGDAFGGLWNGIKGVGSGLFNAAKSVVSPLAGMAGSVGKAVLPSVMPALQGAAAARFGPLGAMGAGLLGNVASQGLDSLSQMGGSSGGQSPMAQTLGQAANTGMQAYMGGQSPYQAMGSAMNHMGSRFSGGLGSAMQGMGGAMQNNQGFGSAMRSGYQGMGGMQGMMNSVMPMAHQAYANYQSGQNPMQSMYGAMQPHMQASMPTQESMENQDNFQEMPFAGDYE